MISKVCINRCCTFIIEDNIGKYCSKYGHRLDDEEDTADCEDELYHLNDIEGD